MSWAETARGVRARALDRCEICRMHQALQGAAFHVDHVVPRSQGGSDDEDNLALCCPTCNLHKSDRTELPDPDASGAVPLFNPRRDRWADHFRWEGYHVVGLTAIGRAVVFAFDLNHARRLLIRQAEERFTFFPPPDPTDQG
jgi:hypothetical protein